MSTRPRSLIRIDEIEQEVSNLVSAISITTLEQVRQRLVEKMEKLQAELEHLKLEEQELQRVESVEMSEPLTPHALRVASKAVKVLETLREKWDMASLTSRQALMQWVVESVTIAPVPEDRKLLQGNITWRGGTLSPVEIVREHDRRQMWAEREKEVLRLWYPTACREDLLSLLPGRTIAGITIKAERMGIGWRSFRSSDWVKIPSEEMKRLDPRMA